MRTERIRASSISLLLDCSYSWQGVYELGMTKPSNGRMHLGTSLHGSTKILDTAKKDGNPINDGDVEEVFYSVFSSPEYDVDWAHDDLVKQQAQQIGLILNRKYHDTYTKNITFAEVEKTIESVIVEVPKHDIAIELTGTMDRSRVVKAEWQIGSDKPNLSYGIVDLKSGKQAVGTDGVAKTKGHAPQLGVYELIEEQTSGHKVDLPARVIGMQTTKSARIGEGTIHMAKERLVGTDQYPGYIEIIAQILKTGSFAPNPRSWLCDKRYCPRWDVCPYR